MTKTEIIQTLAEDCEITQKKAGEVLDSFIELIGDELKAGNDLQIMGFGKFKASLVKGRTGKNPQNPKETLEIPDSMRIYFSAGAKLKEKVNEQLTKAKKTTKKAPAKKTKKK